jgi:hypothetical protein
MLSQGMRQGAVVEWRSRAENGVGELAVAIMAGSVDLDVQAAPAAMGMGRRGHTPCIAGRSPTLIGLGVPRASDGSPG